MRTAESKGVHAIPGEVRVRRQEGIGAATAHAACRGGVDCRLGAGHGEERTANMSNMLRMLVTLEESKLSGWLNAEAPCRESKAGHAVRGAVYGFGGSRRWTATTHAACRRGRDYRLVPGHGEGRTANM